MGNQGYEAEAARLRASFEAEARKSPDAKTILNSGLIDNAVETALSLVVSDSPGPAPVVSALEAGGLDKVSAALANNISDFTERLERPDSDRQAEQLRYAIAQLAWTRGALSACQSLEEGRKWYEVAIDFAPDNFWLRVEAVKFLLWIGKEGDARDWITELPPLADDPDALVTALSEFGDIQERRGDCAAALFYYEMAIGILEGIAGADPENLQARLDLSRAHVDLARMQEATGDTGAAFESRAASLAAARELMSAAAPGDRLLAELYAGQLVDHALAQREAERWDDAERHYREALAALDGAESPHPSGLFVAGLCHEGLGDIREAQQAAGDAAEAWAQARDLYRACDGHGDIPEEMRDRARNRLAEVEEKLAAAAGN